MNNDSFWNYFKRWFKGITSISAEVDTEDAAARIKSAIWFRGPNVWILAFSIIIASVGLNVNSTAVIIGAMLVSPLMGPIIGVGMSLGTNDLDLLRSAARNLLIMVGVSLVASTLYFMISPLSLVNPTELEARTSPTIYDVLIALFGGLAGILENCRKERGTVLSGVALATALMPPLCTAGYGLAHLNMHFFLGALYLFVINSVFIALATYLMVKYLRFRTVQSLSPESAIRQRRVISLVLLIVIVPSIFSAVNAVVENNFERNVRTFVEGNRLVGRSYIYDYKVKNRHVDFSIAGEPLTDSLKADFYARAAAHKIKENRIKLSEHLIGGYSQEEMNGLIDDIYTRTEADLAETGSLVYALQARVDELSYRLDSLSRASKEAGEPLTEDEASEEGAGNGAEEFGGE